MAADIVHCVSIESVSLVNLGPFESISLTMNPGINVFVGANGSGKSILLKLMYAFVRSAQQDRSSADRPQRLWDKAAGVLEPRSRNLSRVVRRRRGLTTGQMVIEMDGGRWTTTIGPKNLTLEPHSDVESPHRAVFLPTKEMLSWYRGFAGLYRDSKLDLEETYHDLAEDLSYPTKRAARPTPWDGISTHIRTSIGGPITVKDDEFVHKTRDGNIEATLMAEGHRKLGTLYHLVQNGRLESSSTLFWDEPEANLNPSLMSDVVTLLGMLAATGMQIFVATHDYAFARLLSLPAEFGRESNVSFHGFYRAPGRLGPALAVTARDLFDLPHAANLLPAGIDAVVEREAQFLVAATAASR